MPARTALTATSLSNDAGVDASAADQAIDQPNGNSITGIGSKDADKLMLLVKNTAGSAKTVTIKAASADPWNQWKGAGDLVVSVGLTTGAQAICLGDGARYRQADGALYVDFQSGFTGTIAAFLLP